MRALLAFLEARRWWVIAAGLILLAAGGFVFYRRYQAEQKRAQALAALRTEVIRRGDIVSKVSATGSLLPEQQSSLFFLIPGTIAEVRVKSGDAVQAGQVLARLEDADLQLAVRQAQDALAVAELNRQKLLNGPSEGDIAVAKANLRSANAALGDLLKGAKPEDVNIAQIKYDNLNGEYQNIADEYNNLVQFSKDHPQFAPPQDTLDALKANMESAFYAAEVARLQLQQAKQGADKGSLAIGSARVAQAKAALDQLLAPLPTVQKAKADLTVEQARTALELAQLRASHAELTAPFDGVVAVVNARAGEPAGGAAPAVVLLDVRHFHLDVAVDEVDIAQLAEGQAVTVTVDALPGIALGGNVHRIAPSATSVAGVVNYTLRVLLDPTDAALRTGMSATAEIVVAEARQVLLVPNWAIRRDRRTGQAYASLKVGEELAEVPIETGLRGDTHTEVKIGVSEGEVAAVSTAREQINLLGGG